METKYDFFKKALKKKQEQKQYTQLRCIVPIDDPQALSQKNSINFSSQDILALSLHSHVKKNTIKYVLEWGAGTTPSRLMTEHLECHRSVEEKIAKLIGKETALLFPSALQVHEQTLATLVDARSLIFIDRFCSHGLIQSALATQAKVIRFEHQNLNDLSLLLEKHQKTPCNAKLIIAESLSGFSGQSSDLKKMCELAEHYQALTYIDDTFAVEILGKHGMGLTSHRKGVDIAIGAFGRSSGFFGAFLGCPTVIRDYLTSFNPQLVETTSLPPAVIGAISAALDLIPDMHKERQKVLTSSAALQEDLRADGWEIGNPTAHIIPIIFNSEVEVVHFSKSLTEAGILATPLLPPILPQGTFRLRLILNVLHSSSQLERLTETLKQLKKSPTFSIV